MEVQKNITVKFGIKKVIKNSRFHLHIIVAYRVRNFFLLIFTFETYQGYNELSRTGSIQLRKHIGYINPKSNQQH